MDVEVVSEKWGKYTKGDIITDMPLSTANAIIKHGIVKEVKEKEENNSKIKKEKKK